jgi:dihydroflavonol-4-reductase
MTATRKILVTGGTGFLGQHVVKRLLERCDIELRLVSTGPLPETLRDADLEWLQGSIVDPDVAAAAVDGVELIYHLAGRVSRSSDDARLMYEVHVDGTRVLLEAAGHAAVQRVVLASTSGTIAVSRDPAARPNEESATRSRSLRAGPTTRASATRNKLRSGYVAMQACGSARCIRVCCWDRGTTG